MKIPHLLLMFPLRISSNIVTPIAYAPSYSPPFLSLAPLLLTSEALAPPCSPVGRQGTSALEAGEWGIPLLSTSPSPLRPPPFLRCCASWATGFGLLQQLLFCCVMEGGSGQWLEHKGEEGRNLISGTEGLEANAQLPRSRLIAGQVAALLPRVTPTSGIMDVLLTSLAPFKASTSFKPR
ncbi:uncharacterized protein LOC110219176 [Phascolarctos cinereus]